MNAPADGRMIRAASTCAERFGFAVFPCRWIEVSGSRSCGKPDCKSPGKHPLTEHGVNDASNDPAVIREWWETWPHANIGIATGAASGFFVIDVDPRHGGNASLSALEAQYGMLPATMRALTGGGGQHISFRLPEGAKIPNSAARLGPGLDVRGDGGYVIAPPSLHASLKQYE